MHFGQPLAKGYKIEYQKPRQTWWNLLFDDHERDSTGHYAISGFFETVEHLAKCPHLLRDVNDWSTDPILLRKVASDYPPVAKILAERLTKEDYDPSKIYTFYDELLEEEHQGVVRELDELVLQRAHA